MDQPRRRQPPAAEPRVMSQRAPKRSMIRPTGRALAAAAKRLIEKPSAIPARDQPNSRSMGARRTAKL
jgi:hypothetical protein